MFKSDSKQQLLEFLNERVFRPTEVADPLSYANIDERKLLKSVQKRVHETRVRYFADYANASEVKSTFVQDLNSKSGQKLASDMWILKLTRFEDVRTDFLALCTRLGL